MTSPVFQFEVFTSSSFVDCYGLKSFSTFAFTEASILINGGHGLLNPSPASIRVVSAFISRSICQATTRLSAPASHSASRPSCLRKSSKSEPMCSCFMALLYHQVLFTAQQIGLPASHQRMVVHQQHLFDLRRG